MGIENGNITDNMKWNHASFIGIVDGNIMEYEWNLDG
jgi:hypothetical protein